ncbi:MAG: PIG-L family deacetylase [Anaerolineales bacterium]|jgi:LmbE family N-acetylglucosaminyl deacetylase|nr:PIG-L family deacetylase [Anaerolineales bacterium]
MTAHLYLSPHLDDAVLSCGGLMAMQDARGEPVSVLTIFAGDPPDWHISPLAADLHARWGKAGPPIAVRRAEDRLACGRLGSAVVHLNFPDAIYRADPEVMPMYPSEEALFGEVHAQDMDLVEQIWGAFMDVDLSMAEVYCPLAMGGHVDHRIIRLAAEMCKRPLTYYFDFPYAARGGEVPPELGRPSGECVFVPLTEDTIESWANAVTEYQTQLSTFWENDAQLFAELRDYHDSQGGIPLLIHAEGTNPELK